MVYFAMNHHKTLSQKRVSPESVSSPHEALGQSEPFLNLQEQLSRVAPIDRPVLLLGERGTGKELAASRIHFLSKRWKGPLVALNCSALAPSLIESELFGYEKGAFTGAERRRTGRFEAAHEGTLFLDEIGNMPLEVQEKTLRLVEYGTFERVGSSKSIEADVRLVAATNVDLVKRTREGHFKADLLDRLSFEVVFLPPLREGRKTFPYWPITLHPEWPLRWNVRTRRSLPRKPSIFWKSTHGRATFGNSKMWWSGPCIEPMNR
jgi:transcriptional regulator with GAF, ATPase, and Fis domain